ncbi:MAG: glycosyltransferase [Nitrospirota bacterium]
MADLKIVYGYPYFASDAYSGVEELHHRYLKCLRDAGLDVEGFCLTLNPPGPCLGFHDLDSRWRRGDRELLSMYERLEEKLGGKNVLINASGINLHPEFVAKLPVFTVFQCFDDIDGLNENLTKPAAHAYDLCLTGNVAEVETYKTTGIRNVEWTPMGLLPDIYDQSLTYEQILNEERDIALFMMIDRLAPWNDRQARLDKLAAAFPASHFYGRGWPRGYLPPAEQVAYLRRAKIGPNVHLATGPLNSRTYHLPANGVMQICDNKKYLGNVFELGKEVVGFDTIDECIDLCRYYLAHDRERRQIAAEGWRRAVKDYNPVAVFSRNVEMIRRYMSQQPQKPATGSITVRQRQRTRHYRLLSSVKSPFAKALGFLRVFLQATGLLKAVRSARNVSSHVYRRMRSYVLHGTWSRQRHLKLHLGCGADHLAGYVNIDADMDAKADLYIDFCNLNRVFSPESVAEGVMIHSLNYLNLWQARSLFRQLHTLLEPGGRLIIELPDLAKCAQRIMQPGQSMVDYLEGVRSIYAFDMSWVENKVVYTPYAFGWSGWHLKRELEHAGFKEVSLHDPQTHGRLLWRDVRVEAVKS